MSLLADALPDTAPLGRDLLLRVRAERQSAEASELAILGLAVEWAYANPALPGQREWVPATLPVWHDSATQAVDLEDVEWHGLPVLRWDAPAAFAAANAMTTFAGKAVIRDALVLAHRVPDVWAAAHAGQITVRMARKVAEKLLGQHDDVCRHVSDAITDRIADGQHIGPVVIEHLLDEAMLRLHAEERELDQIEALDKRHVTIDAATINHCGIVEIDAAADWADAAPFDEKLTEIAQAIKDHPDFPQCRHSGLDERRSIALGIIADPARAQAILEGRADTRPTKVRELAGTLHLTEGNLLGIDPVTTDTDLRARLTQVIQHWAGRHDLALTIRVQKHCGGHEGGCTECPGHIDCDNHTPHALNDYVPSALDKRIVQLSNPTCVHPHCQRPARTCDCDHVIAFDSGGLTCPKCNLAPLCRHHHRLKTHTAWRYWKLDQHTYLWTDPHGLMYLRTRHGTRHLD